MRNDLLYLAHRISGQYDGFRVRAETDFGRGRDHHLVPDARREVRQQERRRARAHRHVAQHVPAGASLDDHLVAGDDAVVRIVRRCVPFQVHRTRVVRGRFDVLGRAGRAWEERKKE